MWAMKNSILYEVKKERKKKKKLGKTALGLEPASWGMEGKIGRNTPSFASNTVS